MTRLHRRIFTPILALCLVLTASAQSDAAAKKKKGAGSTQDLFDGRTLTGWAQSGFDGEAPVKVDPSFKGEGPAIVIEAGAPLSGITWTRGDQLPKTNYELTLEAMRIEGGDFFCGLTFPVGKTACTLVVGGWGGNVVGISSIDDMDASENETASGMDFQDGRWYRIRVRVTDTKLEAWVENNQIADVEWKDKKIGLRPGDIQRSLPLGVATFVTKAAVRKIQLRRL
jgi:hypothetical protein